MMVQRGGMRKEDLRNAKKVKGKRRGLQTRESEEARREKGRGREERTILLTKEGEEVYNRTGDEK